ncbi:Corrinoid adenosyltransferase [subsurface metagenome]|nr:MAG: cob(I)yrinic acid a,c-diamide adenosyltransferase [Dehalococcoidia bacterium]
MATEVELADIDAGIVLVYTGQGKGKSTAALGVALRAAGHGLNVVVIQFPKGDLDYGEYHFVDNYRPFEIVQLNRGETAGQTEEELRSVFRQTFSYAEEVLFEGHHQVVILDEIFDAIDIKMLTTQEVMALIDIKPPRVNLILTGRSAPTEIVKRADMVTEMIRVKHHFFEGIRKAIEGIDY